MRYLVPLVVVCFPAAAQAQAWVDDQHAVNSSLLYTYGSSDDIVESEGERIKDVPVDYHSAVLQAEYVPLENLGVRAQLPFFLVKAAPGQIDYNGVFDNEKFRSTPTDLRLDARYMLLGFPLAVTPLVGFSIPVADYEVHGNGGVGRGLKQAHFGVSAGYYFTKGIPDLFLHASYEYNLVERFKTDFEATENFNQDYSTATFAAGYFITDKLEARLQSQMRYGHGGFEFLDWLQNRETGATTPEAVRTFYNPLLKQRFFLLGGGASYQLTQRLNINAFVLRWVAGSNTGDTDMLGLGLDWSIR